MQLVLCQCPLGMWPIYILAYVFSVSFLHERLVKLLVVNLQFNSGSMGLDLLTRQGLKLHFFVGMKDQFTKLKNYGGLNFSLKNYYPRRFVPLKRILLSLHRWIQVDTSSMLSFSPNASCDHSSVEYMGRMYTYGGICIHF